MATRTPRPPPKRAAKKTNARATARASSNGRAAAPATNAGRAQASAGRRDSLTVTDNRTGKTYDVPIEDGTVRAMDFRQMRTSEDDFGLMTYDPAFTNTASCRSAITYIDGDRGHPRVPRLPHRAARGEEHVPGDGVPAGARRAAVVARAGAVDARHQVLDDGPREHQEVHRWLQLRLAPHGHADRHGRRVLDVLPGREAHRRSGVARAADVAAHRQDADDRGVRLPAQPRAAVRLPRQRPVVHRATS